MRKSWKRIVAAGLAAVTMCTSVNLQAFAEDGTILSAEAKWDGVTMTNSYEGDGYTVTYTLSGYWEGGYNASIRIDNVSQEAIHNWYLRVDSEKDLFNIWNDSIYEETETGYVIKNAGWNQDIPKGGYVEFGISGNKNFDGFPEKCELAGGIQQEDAQCYAVNYHLDNDWQFGFTATINIGAKSDRTIEDWILEFDYNREITSVWNAVIESHEGNHYVIRNVGYNANISNGQDVYFGFQGTGGTSLEEPQNYNLYSYAYNNKIVEEKSIVFDVCGDDVSNIPGVQLVCAGEYAQKPENPVREGFYFTGWYTDEDKKQLFDFDNTQIQDNITLYAGWLDYTNTTDTDGDGIVDSLEEYIGTDINNVDTDMDGLTDYEELYVVGTNPLAADTDGNGIDDYYDDMDGDGICNGDEIKFGTNPAYIDTDTDGLTDYQEIYEYYTNPDMMDTDNDGASDYWEIQNGFDPLVYNDSFKLIVEPEEVSEAAVTEEEDEETEENEEIDPFETVTELKIDKNLIKHSSDFEEDSEEPDETDEDGEIEESREEEPEDDEDEQEDQESEDDEDEKEPLSNQEIKQIIKDFIGKYSGVQGLDKQMLRTLQNVIVDDNCNIFIMGDAKSGKTSLGIDIIKVVNKIKRNNNRKIAKISADKLIGKEMAVYFDKLKGSDLFIENISLMDDDTLEELLDAIDNDRDSRIIVIEDEKVNADKLLERHGELRDYFANRIVVKQNKIKDWVAIAQEYAEEKGYEIDEIGLLALHAKIDQLYGVTLVIQRNHVENVIDNAIKKAEKGGLFKKLFGRKKDKVLTEEHFN